MKLTLKPSIGRVIRCPDGSILAAEGAVVDDNRYWRRRLSDGDVEPGKKEAKK